MPTSSSPATAGSLLGVGLDDLALAMRNARRQLLVASPFMSLPVAQLLVRASDTSRAKTKRLLTAVTVAAVESGYLDPFAIQAFIDAGFEVASLRNLHAKTVLVDDSWGLVGSGNLTGAGLDGGNAELGVVLTRTQARTARREHFERWWAAAHPIDVPAMHKLAAKARPRRPDRHQRQGQGGLFKVPPGQELASFLRDPTNSGYWLKIMYGRQELTRPAGWRQVGWVTDAHSIRDGRAIRRPGYAIGDHLVTYLSRVDPQACPAILRVVDEPRYDPALAARDTPGDEARWGWATPVELIAAIDQRRAPTLNRIGVSGRSVQQQGHIRLSPEQYRRALAAIRT